MSYAKMEYQSYNQPMVEKGGGIKKVNKINANLKK